MPPLLGPLTVPGKFTNAGGFAVVGGTLLGGPDSEFPGWVLDNREKRGGEDSCRVSEVPVCGRGESEISRGFGGVC